jgi:hypothetical protein
MGLIVLLIVPIFCKQKIFSQWSKCRKKKDVPHLIKSHNEINTKWIDDSDLPESPNENPKDIYPPQPNISNPEPNKKFLIYHTQID